jgi:hypothetical protein
MNNKKSSDDGHGHAKDHDHLDHEAATGVHHPTLQVAPGAGLHALIGDAQAELIIEGTEWGKERLLGLRQRSDELIAQSRRVQHAAAAQVRAQPLAAVALAVLAGACLASLPLIWRRLFSRR